MKIFSVSFGHQGKRMNNPRPLFVHVIIPSPSIRNLLRVCFVQHCAEYQGDGAGQEGKVSSKNVTVRPRSASSVMRVL